MKKIVHSLLFAGVVIYSCTSKTVVTSTSEINTSAEYVAKGKTVFDANCGKCHGLPEATDHTPEEWNKIIARMVPKAKLNPEETNWVLAYVTANAKK